MTLAKLRRENARRALLRLRIEQTATKLVRLGARPLLELLLELGEEHDCLEDVADRLEAYARLDPAMVRAVGADRLDPWSLQLVASR